MLKVVDFMLDTDAPHGCTHILYNEQGVMYLKLTSEVFRWCFDHWQILVLGESNELVQAE